MLSSIYHGCGFALGKAIAPFAFVGIILILLFLCFLFGLASDIVGRMKRKGKS